MKIRKLRLLLLPAAMMLTGCGADIDAMATTLQKSQGYNASGASCYAAELAEVMDSEHFDYLLKMLSKGMEMKTSLNTVRKKFGTSYASKIKKNATLNACIE